MSETRITFLENNKIEGWADTQEIVNNFQTLPDALHWKTTPPLTDNFSMTERVGKITLLEYHDGKLWCEATLSDNRPRLKGVNYRFGVKVMLKEYEFREREGEPELLVIKRGELIEIGIIPEIALDGGEKTL